MSWDKSTEGEVGGHRKSVSHYLIYCLEVCTQGSDDKQRPAMTQGAYALLTASNTAMQNQIEDERRENRRRTRLQVHADTNKSRSVE